MNARPGLPVVVGVDGSTASRPTVDVAARLARRHGRVLRVLHAVYLPDVTIPHADALGLPTWATVSADADRTVRQAADQARATVPGLDVTADIVIGAPVTVLLEEARQAAVVVVGDRGRGGFTGLLLGSTAAQVAAHAAGPVLVVRGESANDGDIVVGVDPSAASQRALEFAVDEAARRGVSVTAVHTYSASADRLPPAHGAQAPDGEALADDAALALGEAVAGWADRCPDVKIRQLVVRDRPARSLVRASHGAGLVVVGRRGQGGFAGLALGSVSQAVLHHAACPVAVVH